MLGILLSLLPSNIAKAELIEVELFESDRVQDINIAIQHPGAEEVDFYLVTPSKTKIDKDTESANLTITKHAIATEFLFKDAEPGVWHFVYEEIDGSPIGYAYDLRGKPAWAPEFKALITPRHDVRAVFTIAYRQPMTYNYTLSVSKDNNLGPATQVGESTGEKGEEKSHIVLKENYDFQPDTEYYLLLTVDYVNEDGKDETVNIYSDPFIVYTREEAEAEAEEEKIKEETRDNVFLPEADPIEVPDHLAVFTDFEISTQATDDGGILTINWEGYIPEETSVVYVAVKGNRYDIYNDVFDPLLDSQCHVSYEDDIRSLEVRMAIEDADGNVSDTIYKTATIEGAKEVVKEVDDAKDTEDTSSSKGILIKVVTAGVGVMFLIFLIRKVRG